MGDVPAMSSGDGSAESGNQSPPSFREQDGFLPIANISRIMKKGIPQNGKIAKDSKEFVQECVSEFVSFITSEASNKCKKEKRKTINGDDLLWAMSLLGFEHYIDHLRGYLLRYREGDGKGSTKGAGGSSKKNGNSRLAHQSSYSQGVNYANSQAQMQDMIDSMQSLE
ncbi:CCAAT-box binding factor HAP3 [Heracleum sosnowskyi]|uniref:CCAAT-box binding factor HAP3 n=1 Tax=Heracleum sosnowskyi TaxID=360622 RepID=A0AAD8N2N6_9APIA|nr:CCAAT-box binding factor HAP3 [Heracleum sosnowskyi]